MDKPRIIWKTKKRKIFIEIEVSKRQNNSTDNVEKVLMDAITKVTTTIATVATSNSSYVDVKYDIWTNPSE